MATDHQEIEAVYLNIDTAVIEEQLARMGASRLGDVFYRHIALDFPDYRLDNDNSWIRLRDDGSDVTLAYKKRLGVSSQDGSVNDAGMEEVETMVGNYEDTKRILKKIGLIEKHEAEKKRTRWKKDDVEFDIDTWPGIPTFLEIEATSWDAVDRAAKDLGLDPDSKKICSANQIYKLYGIVVNDYQEIRFSGLVKKRGR